MEALFHAWDTVGQSPEPRLAFDTWQRYLTVTYGQLADQESDDLLRLFLKHTYLASLARLLIWASLSKGKTTTTLRETAKDILSGRFFEEQRIENIVEDDFFHWLRRAKAEAILAPVWERILSQLGTYDLALLNQDILKGVYQELVDPKDRHDLGEYYTPDWLCERIVAELLPAEGFVSVLDPSCGSGSFLRASITHLLNANPHGLRHILENVVGIDIHPLAVIIARATYLLAIRSVVKASKAGFGRGAQFKFCTVIRNRRRLQAALRGLSRRGRSHASSAAARGPCGAEPVSLSVQRSMRANGDQLSLCPLSLCPARNRKGV
jgi:hypothetical protein